MAIDTAADIAKLRKLWADPEMTLKRMAAIFDCHPSTLYHKARKFNLKNRNDIRRKRKRRPERWAVSDIETFCRMWHDLNIPTDQIADHFSTNARTLKSTARRLGYDNCGRFDKDDHNWRCDYCGHLGWCRENVITAYKLPCEREGTPYVDPRERVTVYSSPAAATITVIEGTV